MPRLVVNLKKYFLNLKPKNTVGKTYFRIHLMHDITADEIIDALCEEMSYVKF